MHKLTNLLMEELEEIEDKGSIGFNDLQTIQMLTSSIKNLMRIEEMDTEEVSEMKIEIPDTKYGRMMDAIRDMMDRSDMSLDEKSTLRKTMEILRK